MPTGPTVHKAQGLSLSRVICVSMSGMNAASRYVCASRVRTLCGLVLYANGFPTTRARSTPTPTCAGTR